MQFSQKGLVIRETPLKESDKMLTILTAENGKMTVYAHGVRSYKSKYMHAASLLSYSSFVITRRGDSLTLSEASGIESFPGSQNDLALYALCQYVADVAGELTVFDSPEEQMLSLVLNTLWALCRTQTPRTLVKSAFEIRAMTEAGFMPDIGGCCVCGENRDEMIFDIMNATLYCPGCRGDEEERRRENELAGTATVLRSAKRETLDAMRYVISANPKRIFSFSLPPERTDELSLVTESYLLNHIGHGFTTLNFYKETSRLG